MSSEKTLSEKIQRRDAPEGKSDASASGPGVSSSAHIHISVDRRKQIAARAYELAQQRDFAPGKDVEDWLQAEREIEAGPPRNTAPDNPFDEVRTRSNE